MPFSVPPKLKFHHERNYSIPLWSQGKEKNNVVVVVGSFRVPHPFFLPPAIKIIWPLFPVSSSSSSSSFLFFPLRGINFNFRAIKTLVNSGGGGGGGGGGYPIPFPFPLLPPSPPPLFFLGAIFGSRKLGGKGGE